jgi:hypothetical protein
MGVELFDHPDTWRAMMPESCAAMVSRPCGPWRAQSCLLRSPRPSGKGSWFISQRSAEAVSIDTVG